MNNNNMPRRPGGAPPARAPPGRPPPVNPIDLKRPAGAPPGLVPITDLKPPPRAPPPSQLNQTFQRPLVVDMGHKGEDKDQSPATGSSSSSSTQLINEINAQPKQANYIPTPTKKEGAIAMFETGIERQTTPATTTTSDQKDPMSSSSSAQVPPPTRGPPPGRGVPTANANAAAMMMRSPRPLPPRVNPPGIPDGQPMPPMQKSDDMKKAPAPVKPPPTTVTGGRAPPPEDPETYTMRKKSKTAPLPPTTEPPLLRVKKKEEEVVLKRREKELPEFESSDEEEEGPALVQQPLPFGVLKQPLPLTNEERKIAEEKALKEAEALKQKAEVERKAEEERVLRAKMREMSDAPPADIPKGSRLTGFVPAAPSDGGIGSIGGGETSSVKHLDKHFDDSKIAQSLSRGRLLIKCIEGIDIRRKDDLDKIPRNDSFIKFRLGVAERHPWKNSAVKRKQDSNPQYGGEVISFDITDPAQFVYQEDLQLCIELWNKSMTRDELVGSVTMSVVRFMKQPFVSYTEKVPIYYNGVPKATMKLVLDIVFEEARSGIMEVTLYEVSGIRNIDPMGQQDPYVQFSLGNNYKKRSKTIKNGGTNPYFEEEILLLWIDQDNWVNNLKVQVLDDDAKEEKPIGETNFSLLPYMKGTPDDAKEDTYDLFYYILIDPKDESEKKEVACGEIIMKIRFLPAGKLTVLIDRAKDLEFPEAMKPAAGEIIRLDPYANLTVEGKAVKMIKRTPADKDGGYDPVWESEIHFDIVDQYLIDLEIFNQNLIGGKDILLGSTQISLLNVFRSGVFESWLSLKQKKANGGIKAVGDIFVRLVFTGPVAIAFPQLRTEVDSFDDAIRNEPKKKAKIDPDLQVAKREISTIPDDDSRSAQDERKSMSGELQQQKDQQEKVEIPPEFTESEMIAAFKFIDLDHNDFVGAGEIRHILVCMGEMITDEEIDMMISMVDMDGDGQISYKEFRTLVLHPNPGGVDMHKEISKEKDNEVMKEKQALAGKVTGVDLTAFQRQKEITVREQKKKMIVQFVIDNEVDFIFIKRCHSKFLDLPLEKRPNGRVRFQEFCLVCDIEPIQEYKNLHTYYDTEEMGDMDIREFFLSMMNFIEVEKDERIKFSFEMFDELKTGFISIPEIERILSGNHILSITSIKRKAETIMKQANARRDNTTAAAINMKEFVVVSKKFPNILLPAVGFIPEIKIPVVDA